MDRNRIESLIIKFLNRDLNRGEWEELNAWCENPKQDRAFYDFLEINYAIDHLMSEFQTERTKQAVLKEIRRSKRSARMGNLLKYAAVFVVMLSAGYFFLNRPESIPEAGTPEMVQTQIQHGTDKAVLTLGDGSEVALQKGEAFTAGNLSSNGTELIYDGTAAATGETAYNFLTIPRGGQFRIVLSDGTVVWLNSESQLKYPVHFSDGQAREVELVYGEAYFDVSPADEHRGSAFRVIHPAQMVEVLGTEFNIKAYRDEREVRTTLIEGKVAVRAGVGSEFLEPSEQSRLDTGSGVLVVTAVDVYSEISWKEGVFTFESLPLREVARVLARWYDIEFVFEDSAAQERRFNGTLRRNLEISEILEVIRGFDKINGYEIDAKTVVIK